MPPLSRVFLSTSGLLSGKRNAFADGLLHQFRLLAGAVGQMHGPVQIRKHRRGGGIAGGQTAFGGMQKAIDRVDTIFEFS